MASIVLVGLAANDPRPGTYVELDFAQGPVTGSGSPRTAIVLGNKTASGTATNDTVIYGPDTQTPCQTEADAIALFGAGSQLHRAFLRFSAVNKINSLYFVAVTPSAGAAATLVETIATTATSNGNHRTWCVDQFVDTAISNGDTPTTIAANIAISVNAQTRWPVTANAVVGAVTYTAKNTGPEGNWIRMQALITPATASIGTTTTLTANTFMSGGATSDVNTTALSTILPGRYYYIISCDSDATNVGRVATQVTSQAQPTVGIRQRLVFGSMDTLANTITVATGINSARAECVWANATDLTPYEAACNNTALYMLLEAGSPYGVNRKNFSLFPSSSSDSASWLVAAGRSGIGGGPTQAQVLSALNNGITPIAINVSSGSAYLVKRCTTRSLTGAVQDYRVRDAHKVTVCDYWCDDVAAVTQLQFGGKDLLPDFALGQQPSPNAVTPRVWGNAIKAKVSDFGNAGQWSYPPGVIPQPGASPADTINANIVVQIEVASPNRMSALVQLSPVAIADQFALLVLQVA